MTPARTTLTAGAVAAGVVAVDQLTKALVRDNLAFGERRDLFAGVDIVNVRNSGVAFGFLEGGGAVLDFVRDVSEPYLRLFRRLPLQIGPLDLSPMVAILVLQIAGGLIVRAIEPGP